MRDWSVPEPPANGALMLIDFQSDFLDDAGRMPVARNHVEPALSAAASAARLYKQHGQPVVAIGNQFRRRDYVMNLLRGYAALEGSPGARWDPRLPLDDIAFFAKWETSAFCNPDLATWLTSRRIGTLVMCGLMARACVSATATEAMKRGFTVILFEPAIACASDRSRARALKQLERKGARLSGS
jgi:nicotinamidase-related amidase